MGAEISTELAEVPEAEALAVFTTAGDVEGTHKGLDPYLAKVRAALDAFEGDVSTAVGRDHIRSVAARVARYKTYLEKIGKGLADDAKSLPKKIDAGRRYANAMLETWQADVRKPLTEWEDAEEKRRNNHVAKIEGIRFLAAIHASWKIADYRNALERLDEFSLTPTDQWEEFADGYRTALDQGCPFLRLQIESMEKAERDAAELEVLRAEKAARDAEAAEQRRKQDEADRITRAAQEAADKAARAATEAAQRAGDEERRQAEAREADLRRQVAEATRREQAERARLAEEERQLKAREANRNHRTKVNRAAVDAIVAMTRHEKAATPVDDATAIHIVSAIVRGEIPAVSIAY